MDTLQRMIRFCTYLYCLACLSCALIWDPVDKETGEAGELPDSGQTQGAAISAPIFEQSAGALPALSTIGISCGTSGAVIYYTSDGSAPSTSSLRYDPSKKPLLMEDCVFKAVAVKDGQSSDTVAAAYSALARFPGFVFQLESGMRWDYTEVYRYDVLYSYFGNKSWSTSKDFSIVLGTQTTKASYEAFPVIVLGDYTLRWNWLASDGYRLLGSRDGTSFEVLFDALLGIWVGQGFFLDATLLSAIVAGDIATVAQGWQMSQDGSVYYPGTGTIHDPGAWSMYSDERETYRSGIGPVSYTYSKGYTDSYESAHKSWSVTFKSFTTGVDYTNYQYDRSVLPGSLEVLSQLSAQDKVKVLNDSSFTHFIVYAEFITADYDMVLTVLDGDFNYIVENFDQNRPRGTGLGPEGRDPIARELTGYTTKIALEIYKTPALSKSFYVWVRDSQQRSSGEYRIGVIPIRSVANDGSLDTYQPSEWAPLTVGSYTLSSVALGTFSSFQPSALLDASTTYYCFAIPYSTMLNLAVAIVDQPGASTNFWYHKVNQSGPGMAEAFQFSTATTSRAVNFNVFDLNYATPGSFIFGFGCW